MSEYFQGMSRRSLLSWIGKTAGAAAMYQAMTTLGFAAESEYDADFALSGAPAGTSVLVLGGGLAGMTAAYELRKAGYKVKVLEFREKAGGRCWTLRGGDSYKELGGQEVRCEFDPGQYINPGPWRIPYHHYAVINYCRKFGVELETFNQINFNALLHSRDHFGGKPKRYREVLSDFDGYVAEMLAKAINTKSLNDKLTQEDGDKLLEAMRDWGALSKDYTYTKSELTSLRRGWKVEPGGGLMPMAVDSTPIDPSALINSGLWRHLYESNEYEYQSTLFEPKGGMDMIAQAFAKQVGDLIRYNSKVTRIHQDDTGVTVNYTNTDGSGQFEEKADWCVCTIPLSILGQIPMNVSSKMHNAIRAVPYDSSVKVGLQFKRRFWEEDDNIFGGITWTDLPIEKISYPSTQYLSKKGVLLGAYMWGANAFEFTAMDPKTRVQKVLEYGAQIHPQYKEEFETGVGVGWHRVPWTQGCYGLWTPESRKEHYDALCQIDNRIVLAGEHTSYIPAWMEGAVLSALDSINRLNQHIVASQNHGKQA